jgi:hypothetical protein
VLDFSASSVKDDGWLRLSRDRVALMFMRNEHLGAPRATAVQYIYVYDVYSTTSWRFGSRSGIDVRPNGA